MLQNFNNQIDPTKPYHVYIFVRKDLSTSEQAVQSSHAAIEAAKNFGLKELPDHPHLVILGVKNEKKLDQALEYLEENGIRHYGYREPDYDDSLTAIATEPLQGDVRKLFKKWQLLKPVSAKEAA